MKLVIIFYSNTPKRKKIRLFVETWILFRKNDEVVSNVIQEAYRHYEAMEFGGNEKEMFDPQRHIKLINIAKDVKCFKILYTKSYMIDKKRCCKCAINSNTSSLVFFSMQYLKIETCESIM